MKKLTTLLLALVLSACTTPAQTVDTDSQKAPQCQCVKCHCQHCKKGNCDCAHDKDSAKGEICDIEKPQ